MQPATDPPGRGPEASDEELAIAAAAGDGEAFRQLVRRFERPVFGLVVRLVRDRATAEDLAQEAFLRAFRALPSYDPGRRFASWLLRIAHNAAIDSLRRRGPRTVSLGVPADDEEGPGLEVADRSRPDPEQEATGRDVARQLEAGLRRLRPEHRTALLLRFRDELPYEEIAAVMGIPLGTVKTFIHRARQELARQVPGSGR
jgi:RNA polymerase sigma-70 factor (ECF subfamily)